MKKITVIFPLFIAIFFLFYVKQRERSFLVSARSDIASQAEAISNSLWLFDEESCQLNLNFFINLSDYSEVTVVDYVGALFSSASSKELGKLNLILKKVGLIRSIKLEIPIFYNSKEIGKIRALKYNKLIYNYFYLSILFILGYILLLTLSKLKSTNLKLEELVVEKSRLLRSSDEELHIILNSIGDGVLAVDNSSHIIQINPSAKKILLLENIECVGHLAKDILPINLFNQDGTTLDFSINSINDVTMLTGDIIDGDKKKLLDIVASPILDESNKQLGVVFIFSDITEKDKLDRKMQHSQKMESIGVLAGGIAHDFNNMLAGIIGAADLLQDELKDDQKKLMDIIVNSAEGAAKLTNKLLSFSRKGNVKTSVIDVHNSINSTISILSHTIDPKIKIKTHFKADFSFILGDNNQLQNVFLNLAINSSHAIDGDGHISFATENIFLSKNDCENYPEFNLKSGDFLQISISDDGCGIPDDVIKKIFEPFFTTKKLGKGTGLGLAACYGAVQEHGGAIVVSSVVGEGTTFSIYLPLSDKIDNKFNSSKPIINRGVGSILVVDDEDMVRTTAKLMLQKIGYNVFVAVDGEDAITVYSDNKDKIDMVLLDIRMPIMNGRECFKELRKKDPKLKIVFASGFSRDTDDASIDNYDVNAFLRKPYTIEELSSICSEVLKS